MHSELRRIDAGFENNNLIYSNLVELRHYYYYDELVLATRSFEVCQRQCRPYATRLFFDPRGPVCFCQPDAIANVTFQFLWVSRLAIGSLIPSLHQTFPNLRINNAANAKRRYDSANSSRSTDRPVFLDHSQSITHCNMFAMAVVQVQTQ